MTSATAKLKLKDQVMSHYEGQQPKWKAAQEDKIEFSHIVSLYFMYW